MLYYLANEKTGQGGLDDIDGLVLGCDGGLIPVFFSRGELPRWFRLFRKFFCAKRGEIGKLSKFSFFWGDMAGKIDTIKRYHPFADL